MERDLHSNSTRGTVFDQPVRQAEQNLQTPPTYTDYLIDTGQQFYSGQLPPSYESLNLNKELNNNDDALLLKISYFNFCCEFSNFLCLSCFSCCTLKACRIN